jgi:hypothetical protein
MTAGARKKQAILMAYKADSQPNAHPTAFGQGNAKTLRAERAYLACSW